MDDRDNESPADKIKRLIREASSEQSSPSNVADFFTEAQKRGRSISPPPTKKSVVRMQITGNNSAGVIGDGNHIQINVKTPPTARPKVNVQPSSEHISDTQAAEVKELVNKIASVTGRPHAFVWSTLKRKYRFTKYQLITHDKYDDIIKYLRGWIARYDRIPKSVDERRLRNLARIHAEAKKRKGTLEQVYAYTQEHFGTASLSKLTQAQLVEVIYQFGF